MRRFIVEVSDVTTGEDIHTALYYEEAIKEIGSVVEVKETWEFANGDTRMTTAQRDKLWSLCGGYNVPFHEDHYRPTQFSENAPVMYEGWVGGIQSTIYVGVEPNGRSHS